MFIWFIITIAIAVIFYLGIKYRKGLEKSKTSNKESFESFPSKKEFQPENKSVLTITEKRTAIETLEKLGYKKIEIINLLGEEIYDN
jgi:hypothetical protein